MHASRLLALAAKLDTVDLEFFHIVSWMSFAWRDKKGFAVAHCGTVACAVGWACTMPEFNEMGLRIKKYGFDQYKPVYKNHSNWAAVEKFFNLSYNEAQYLFDWESYDNQHVAPFVVAARIREFVANHS